MDLIDEFVNETLNRPERFISRDSPVSSDSLEVAKHIFEMRKNSFNYLQYI